MPFPFPGDLPDPGIEPASSESSALAGGFFTTEPPGKPCIVLEQQKRRLLLFPLYLGGLARYLVFEIHVERVFVD